MTRYRLAALLALGLLPLAARAEAQDIEAAAQLHDRTLPRAYYERVQQTPDFFEIRHGWKATAARALQQGGAVEGSLPLVVVQALFADSPEPSIAAEEIQRLLFDGPAPYGTLTEFYRETSGGRLEVTGRALPWVRTGISRAEAVGGSYGLGADSRVGTFLLQALEAADTLVDFGEFDNDGPDGVPNSGDDDGYVDAVAFQFIERAASCGGNGIWPHRSRISNWSDSNGVPFATDDERAGGGPVLVNDYIIQSTVECGGDEPQTAAVIAHELGHVLGLPDLYDSSGGILPSQRRWVVGCWALMAAGAWGCGDGAAVGQTVRPTHMGAWEKEQLGWAAKERVREVRDREFVLDPVQIGGRMLEVPLSTTEYLLVEYRPTIGFDQDLPASGVLVYHIDPSRPFRPCGTCDRIYRVALVEADGNRALQKTAPEGGNRGEAGDAFAATGEDALTGATTPSTRLNTGAASPVAFHSIRVVDGVARIRLSTAVDLTIERLLQALTLGAGTPLTEHERAYLDGIGNANGRYDVGDLRAYLRANPGLVPAGTRLPFE